MPTTFMKPVLSLLVERLLRYPSLKMLYIYHISCIRRVDCLVSSGVVGIAIAVERGQQLISHLDTNCEIKHTVLIPYTNFFSLCCCFFCFVLFLVLFLSLFCIALKYGVVRSVGGFNFTNLASRNGLIKF